MTVTTKVNCSSFVSHYDFNFKFLILARFTNQFFALQKKNVSLCLCEGVCFRELINISLFSSLFYSNFFFNSSLQILFRHLFHRIVSSIVFTLLHHFSLLIWSFQRLFLATIFLYSDYYPNPSPCYYFSNISATCGNSPVIPGFMVVLTSTKTFLKHDFFKSLHPQARR